MGPKAQPTAEINEAARNTRAMISARPSSILFCCGTLLFGNPLINSSRSSPWRNPCNFVLARARLRQGSPASIWERPSSCFECARSKSYRIEELSYWHQVTIHDGRISRRSTLASHGFTAMATFRRPITYRGILPRIILLVALGRYHRCMP